MTAAAPVKWDTHSIRALERDSIREFVSRNRQYLTGRVLDFGAGKPGTCRQPEPYRDLVSGEYVPIDKGDRWPAGRFDAVLCTQVMQYLEDPADTLRQFLGALKPGGWLVMTYPTSWDEVEHNDLWRFTQAGMELLLKRAGFKWVYHTCRASVPLGGFKFPLGNGVIAYRPIAAAAIESGDQRSTAAENTVRRRRGSELNADGSAAELALMLRNQLPFLFLRYGDGAIECINGIGRGHTCDQERYSPDLGRDLKAVWDACIRAPRVYVGDWLSASFGSDRRSEYSEQYSALIGDANPHFLHFESLLLTRESQVLLDFYRTVKADTRKKVYLGPEVHAPGARALGCQHIVTPIHNLFASVEALTAKLAIIDFDVLFWACGMAGSIPVIRTWEQHPERTYINLGSALDPLYRGRTRSGQLTTQQALRFFRGVF